MPTTCLSCTKPACLKCMSSIPPGLQSQTLHSSSLEGSKSSLQLQLPRILLHTPCVDSCNFTRGCDSSSSLGTAPHCMALSAAVCTSCTLRSMPLHELDDYLEHMWRAPAVHCVLTLAVVLLMQLQAPHPCCYSLQLLASHQLKPIIDLAEVVPIAG